MPIDTLSLIFLAIGLSYLMFMRQFNNAIIHVFKNKDYVIAHIRKTGNRKIQTHYIIPNAKENFLTKVPFLASRRYEIRPDEYNWIDKNTNRKHYIFNEEDAMGLKISPVEIDETEKLFLYKGKLFFNSDDKLQPIKIDPRTTDDYLLASKRVNGAMASKTMRILHEEQNHIMLYIAIIAFFVIVAVAVYGIMQYQKLAPLVETIYQNTIVGNNPTIISPAPVVTPK